MADEEQATPADSADAGVGAAPDPEPEPVLPPVDADLVGWCERSRHGGGRESDPRLTQRED